MPTFSSGPLTCLPATETAPEETGRSPEIILSSVLLPHPLGPTMETKLPGWISKEILSSAVTGLAPPLKTRETSLMAMNGGTARFGWLALDELVGVNFLCRHLAADVEVLINHSDRFVHDVRFHMAHADIDRLQGQKHFGKRIF